MIPAPKVRQAICAWFHRESDLDDSEMGLYPEHWQQISVEHRGPGIIRHWARDHDLELPMEDLDASNDPGIVRTVEKDDDLVVIDWHEEPTGIYLCASIRYREIEVKTKSDETPGYGEWA